MHSCGIPRWLLSRPPRWLKRLPSTAAACRATVSPLHDDCVVIAAPLCYTVALPRRSAVLRLPLPLLPTVALLLRAAQLRLRYCRSLSRRFVYCRDAAPRRACCRTASLRCGRVAQLLLSYSPPNRFATAAPLLYTAALLRSAPLRVTLLHAASSAPRRLAAAALLRCCRAASLLPLHSASSSRIPKHACK